MVTSLVILALPAMCALMAGAWALARLTRRSGWVDPLWSAFTGLMGVAVVSADAPASARRLVVAGLLAVWSGRLAVDLARRAGRIGNDPRYEALLAEWGAAAAQRLFWFLQAQALAGWVLIASASVAAGGARPFPTLVDGVGVLVALGGLAIETVADRQLAAFRRAGRVNAICEIGLWGRSRHPNYLGEILFWLGVALCGVDPTGSYPLGFLALAAPAQMYWLLTRVSGAPPLEQHMARTRGPLFDDYCRRVPLLFPRLRATRQ